MSNLVAPPLSNNNIPLPGSVPPQSSADCYISVPMPPASSIGSPPLPDSSASASANAPLRSHAPTLDTIPEESSNDSPQESSNGSPQESSNDSPQDKVLPPDEFRCTVTKKWFKPDGRCANTKAVDHDICEMHLHFKETSKKRKAARKNGKGSKTKNTMIDLTQLSPDLQARIRQEQGLSPLDPSTLTPEEQLQQWKKSSPGRNVIIHKKYKKEDDENVASITVSLSTKDNNKKSSKVQNFYFERSFPMAVEVDHASVISYKDKCLRKVISHQFFKKA